jgi:hypothetical protein
LNPFFSCIPFSLVLEKKKIIPNAFEDYTNHDETLEINYDVFESPHDLCKQLNEEQEKF